MPIYEYSCEACGATFETMQRITEPPAETCELCGAGPVHKLISQSTFILKGSGWYVTDYGKGKNNDHAAKKEQAESKPTDASDRPKPKTDAKPKTESKSKA